MEGNRRSRSFSRHRRITGSRPGGRSGESGAGAWNYAVSPLDGRFLMFKPVAAGNALVSFKVVVNWFEELKRLVPAN